MTRSPADDNKLIDWSAARARLARAAEATRDAAKPSRKQAAQILEARARALAESKPDAGDRGRMLQLVAFHVGGERFGLESRYVRGVGRELTITPLPACADHVVGVTSFRGEIHAVFDIRTLFGGGRRDPTASSRVLFLGRQEIEFAILADSVDALLSAPADEITSRPWRLDQAAAGAASGLTPDALNVLDGAALLSDSRLFIDQVQANPDDLGGES